LDLHEFGVSQYSGALTALCDNVPGKVH